MTHRLLFLFSLLIGVFLIYVSHVVLMPIIVGATLAYLLWPIKRCLTCKKLSSFQATLVVFVPILTVFVLFLVFVIPSIHEEFWNFLMLLPQYGQLISDRLLIWQNQLNQIEFLKKFTEMPLDLGSFVPDLLQLFKMSVFKILSSTSFLTDLMIYTILVPIFTFYFLKDYEVILEKASQLIPRPYLSKTREVFEEIDKRLINYVRGQFLLSLLFSGYYCFFLSLVGLKHALIIGILTGMFFFIPIFTFYISLTTALVLAYLQFDFSWSFFVVVIIYLVAQILENLILVPRIMGNKVGLSPIWILIALYVGGTLFGAVGIILAIPVAAILDVLIKFSLKYYFKSAYYTQNG